MFRFVLGILILIAGLVWLTNVQPVFATSANFPLISLPLQSFTASALDSQSTTEPLFDGDGVVFIDTTAGTPGVPYIVYETPQHGFGMKSLIFNIASDDPCQVSAGELPCARDIQENDPSESDASPISSGTVVHLVGEVDDQAIVVSSYSQIHTVPSGMHMVTVPFNTTATLPNSTSLTPLSVMDNASCTLGIGCFGNGVDRLSVTVSSGNSTTDTEIVPGTIFMYGNSAIILLSLSGIDDEASANFLVVDN